MKFAREDPMEKIIALALMDAGQKFKRDHGGENPSGLDFLLESGIEIEVKRFHTPRISEQMSRAENVIAAQGIDAVSYLATLIRADGLLRSILHCLNRPNPTDQSRIYVSRSKHGGFQKLIERAAIVLDMDVPKATVADQMGKR